MDRTNEQRRFAADSRYALISGIATITLVSVLVLAKTWAWLESGSASVLASLVDSLMDVGVSTMNLMVIRISLMPADKEHRYGHGKAEGIAALFQSAFIAGIAVFLLLESVRRFLEPQAVVDFDLAISVMALSMVVSIVMVTIQKLCMKKAPSLAVEADSAHYTSDILVNGGTILTLLVLKAGAPGWVDPFFALLVVGYLLWTVRDIAVKGVDMLMDRELPGETRREIKDIILAHREARGVHDLRTRQIGMRWAISFDIEMDPHKPLCEIHKTTREIERRLVEKFPQAEIMIHMDPAGDKADSRHPEGDGPGEDTETT